ncbi:MAG: methyltransferase domain-containing protein [Micavibrio aeruginosavorus]|uniref:Methyltransferase domain-containing protein n=1 Tax=Micavibrio aeruginosavorus TaxID=349221 RepID=A0A7T5UG32_9BACT|nr:MAG: methyltransferase domain-containing protein [Micavibrio aeruginosavorus]
MAQAKVSKLRDGHRKALGFEETDNSAKPVSRELEKYYQRHEHLKGIAPSIIRKAWFTMSHLLLHPGARVVDMGSNDGAVTYAMAALNPEIHFTGIDLDKKKIAKSKAAWKLSNLDFQVGDITAGAGIKEGSLDAIVNSFILHELYSNSRYNDRPVVHTLEKQFSLLKNEGLMLIRDFALPQRGEYVLLEMPDVQSRSTEPGKLSEPDLLVWYAEHARPKDDPGCHGFFLEELPPRFPQTRLFRLHYKWAYEFILRKDNRSTLDIELPKEYAFFTEHDYRRHLSALGARLLYSSPHWDEKIIRERFEGRFRLYSDDGTPLGSPPTSFIAVAQKMSDRRSLRLQERRPSQKNTQSRLRVSAMRNDITGKIVDVVSRDSDMIDVIPYRVSENGTLTIFVQEGLPRGIVNAVPRNGKNLDQKMWSGHMTEAICLPGNIVRDISRDDQKKTALFARDHLGLKPASGSTLEDGPVFYPAPDYIDERFETRYLRVESREGNVFDPKYEDESYKGFASKGKIREVNAQSVLDAISVGIIPNARLEQQIVMLFSRLGMTAESWNECPLILAEEEPDKKADLKDIVLRKAAKDSRFKKIKGTTGHLRTIQSVFVDEGWVEGGVAGLASRDLEFVISDETTVNKAVILPLTKSHSGEVMAGFCMEHLPIPQRYSGNGMTVTAPSLDLPREITNIEMARRYIAEKFEVPVENVSRMGESFFCHSGVTPQRIFPFALTGVARGVTKPLYGMTIYAPLAQLCNLLWYDCDLPFMVMVARTFGRLGAESEHSVKRDFAFKIAADHSKPMVSYSEDMRGLGGAKTDDSKSGEKIVDPESKKRLDPK